MDRELQSDLVLTTAACQLWLPFVRIPAITCGDLDVANFLTASIAYVWAALDGDRYSKREAGVLLKEINEIWSGDRIFDWEDDLNAQNIVEMDILNMRFYEDRDAKRKDRILNLFEESARAFVQLSLASTMGLSNIADVTDQQIQDSGIVDELNEELAGAIAVFEEHGIRECEQHCIESSFEDLYDRYASIASKPDS